MQDNHNTPSQPPEAQSTPKKKCVAFFEEETLPKHDIASLGVALRRLRITLRRASEVHDDPSIEMLKASLDMIKTKRTRI